MDRPSGEPKNTTYELFVAALSVLSIINLVLYYLVSDPIVHNLVGIDQTIETELLTIYTETRTNAFQAGVAFYSL